MRGAPGMRALDAGQRKAAQETLKSGFQKFKPGKDPIELEGALTVIQPQTKIQAQAVKTLLERMRGTAMANGDDAALSAIEMWQTNYEMDAANDDIKLAFMRDWWYWLLGRGSDADTERTPWGRANVAALNDEVAAYVETFIAKRLEWALKLVALRERVPRTLNEYYLFYKYIVRGNIARKKDDKGVEYFDFNDEDFLQDWELMYRQFESVEQAEGPHVADSLTDRPQGVPAFDGHEPYAAAPAPDFLDKLYDNFDKTLTERFEKRVQAELEREHRQRMSRAQRSLHTKDFEIYKKGEAELRAHAASEYDIIDTDEKHIDDLIDEVAEMANMRRRFAEDAAKDELSAAKEHISEISGDTIERAKKLKSDILAVPSHQLAENAQYQYEELDEMMVELKAARDASIKQAEQAIKDKFEALGETSTEKFAKDIRRNTEKIRADFARAEKQIEKIRDAIEAKVTKVRDKERDDRKKFEESLNVHEGLLWKQVVGDEEFDPVESTLDQHDDEIRRLEAEMTALLSGNHHSSKEDAIEAMVHNDDIEKWKATQRERLAKLTIDLEKEIMKRKKKIETARAEAVAKMAAEAAKREAEAAAALAAAEADAEFEEALVEQLGAAAEEAIEVEMQEADEVEKKALDEKFKLLPKSQAAAVMDIADEIAPQDEEPLMPPTIPVTSPTLGGFEIPRPPQMTDEQEIALRERVEAARLKRARENGGDDAETKKAKEGTVEDKIEEVKELVEATQEAVLDMRDDDVEKREREEEEIPEGETQPARAKQRAVVEALEEEEKAPAEKRKPPKEKEEEDDDDNVKKKRKKRSK